jgi:hypothetical protein
MSKENERDRPSSLHARYSLNDLRHAFAERLYQETKDVYQVEDTRGTPTLPSRRPICDP